MMVLLTDEAFSELNSVFWTVRFDAFTKISLLSEVVEELFSKVESEITTFEPFSILTRASA